MAKKLSPLMEQYWQQKKIHHDKILLFRMGDFYELFDEDAIVAAPILGIALTVRNRKSEDHTKMCGFPHHSVASPINKLLQAGYKIAICEQLEDPKKAKGLVKRGVVRILSPGMVYDPSDLEANRLNFLCSYDEKYISFLEASTGEAFYFSLEEEKEVSTFLDVLQPSELVLSSSQKEDYFKNKNKVGGPFVSVHDSSSQSNFAKEPESMQRLVSYSCSMQGEDIIKSLKAPELRLWNKSLHLSLDTFKHLEIFQTYQGEKQGSLFYAINRTRSSGGSRLLKYWLMFPLLDKIEIQSRLDQVEFWIKNYYPANDICGVKEIRNLLSDLGDVERRLGKISHPNSNPKDIYTLALSLEKGLELCAKTSFYSYNSDFIIACDKFVTEVFSAFIDEPTSYFNKDYFLKRGYRKDLDELIDLSENAESHIRILEEKEREETGISSLKIRYNQVFGYYIEVTNTHKSKVPNTYLRKQTLTNAERYTTEELQELEKKILSAKAKRFAFENTIFDDFKEKALKLAPYFLTLAKQWAEIDVFTSLASLAKEQKYEKPIFTDNKEDKIEAKSLRHPVIEQISEDAFISNDLTIQNGEVILLTGPNMAGKSTIMRQVALAQIMAQIGSYVPASHYYTNCIDRIFTRIGASDSQAEGLSTFMVEMTEVAHIFKHKTDKSLILLDEVGRGTSTYDGMSLAQAILEEIIRSKTAYCFFATHYHELTILDKEYKNLNNYHMEINEKESGLKFLYKLKKGAANKSYGVHVAILAGVPNSITDRASNILKSLELNSAKPMQFDLFSLSDVKSELEAKTQGLSPPVNGVSPLEQEIQRLSIDNMSPIEAFQWLHNKKKSIDQSVDKSNSKYTDKSLN